MEEAKDLVFISLSFTTGIAAGALFKGFLPIACAVSSILSVILVLFVLRSRHPHISVGLLFLSLGIFCACTEALTYVAPEAGFVEKLALNCCERLKVLIDSLPFADKASAPMIKALLTGDRSDIPVELVRNFRAAGASHILALSGMHLGVTYLALRKILCPIGNSPFAKRIKWSLLVTLAGFYTLMTGAGASLVRALLFIVLNETAILLHRHRKPSRILLAALTIQLAANPSALYSAGFQLSYLAICGIVFIMPLLVGPYKKFKLWNMLAMSLACQLTTAPLSWFYFHSFPRHFLLTNIIAMPLSSGIMMISLPTITLSALGICPELLVEVTDYAARSLAFALEVIAGM